MCFICSQPEGFETDILKVIRLGKNSAIKITSKELPQTSNLKTYSTVNSELNQTIDETTTYEGEFSDYKFYNKGNGVYEIKTELGFEDITRKKILTFSGEEKSSSFKEISIISDIKDTFDQITGLNTNSGSMFRLYNAAFKRLPDPEGLAYWIDRFSSGIGTKRDIASSFTESTEFKKRYGENVTDSAYVNTLYKNVLGREADTSGMNYWLGQLTSGRETRYEALLGFAESAENKALFTEMTGFG